MERNARLLATVIALAAWAGLVAQFILAREDYPTALAALWRLARFFTILTNLMVAVSFTGMAITGRRPAPGWLAALALWIAIVGVIYHLLLADYGKTGLDLVADHLVHTAVPLLTVGWWFAYALHLRLPRRLAAYWLGWPLGYLVYALIRGAADGIYPYFFLDVARFGAGQIAVNVAALAFGFWLAGLGMIGVARLRARRVSLARV
ncbi:Pr6Pr family membrane protein [Maritimibacter sp. DP1N21-5]|uniref:Pr6Pr family membrane protein n=1 Tax=Maritimibacter sp. DP1N21-5 TaxID=2836867 RepID=UPI001C458F2B|nr:Pr6Pr family membrane protein [Maritimibacter sp. DP1N21-5]MBV7407897.1 Pr6Pr family membrane protein [Maritimibacter sp. DP1N21-5]